MKASSWLWVVALSLGFGAPSCGGKSEVGAHEAQGGDGGAAGSDGFAGSGAGPATHVSECQSLCDNAVDVGCTTDGTSCMLLCATVTGYDGCQSQIEDWLACAKGAELTCDASGMPTFDGCDTQLLLVTACAAVQEPPAAVAASCTDFCQQVDDAGCTVDSTYGGCEQLCGGAGMVVSACQQAFVNWTNCQSQATITCDDTGAPQLTGCESQQLVFAGCVMMETGGGTLGVGGAASQ